MSTSARNCASCKVKIMLNFALYLGTNKSILIPHKSNLKGKNISVLAYFSPFPQVANTFLLFCFKVAKSRALHGCRHEVDHEKKRCRHVTVALHN